MFYSADRAESLDPYEDRFALEQDSFKLPEPHFSEKVTTRASLRGAGYRGSNKRRVVIDDKSEHSNVEYVDPVLREHSLDQVMDYLQRVGETALIEQVPITLLQLDIPSPRPLHPDGFRYIDGI